MNITRDAIADLNSVKEFDKTIRGDSRCNIYSINITTFYKGISDIVNSLINHIIEQNIDDVKFDKYLYNNDIDIIDTISTNIIKVLIWEVNSNDFYAEFYNRYESITQTEKESVITALISNIYFYIKNTLIDITILSDDDDELYDITATIEDKLYKVCNNIIFVEVLREMFDARIHKISHSVMVRPYSITINKDINSNVVNAYLKYAKVRIKDE